MLDITPPEPHNDSWNGNYLNFIYTCYIKASIHF